MSKYKQHRDNDYNKTGTSEEKSDWLGNDYMQHRDDDYEKTGTSEEKTDWLGDDYTQHRDSDYNKSGTSEEKTDWLGNEYTQHYDSDGNKSGTSETKTDWLGNEYTQHYDDEGNETGTSEDKDGCFISTACVRAKGLSDDCQELTVLRQFRDKHLKRTEAGKQLINKYYAIAPRIVDEIRGETNPIDIYAEIYQNLVSPCVNLINEAKLEEAQALYSKQVGKLSARYLD